jgi:hypothetical protein
VQGSDLAQQIETLQNHESSGADPSRKSSARDDNREDGKSDPALKRNGGSMFRGTEVPRFHRGSYQLSAIRKSRSLAQKAALGMTIVGSADDPALRAHFFFTSSWD